MTIYLTIYLFGLLSPLTTKGLTTKNDTICIDCSKEDMVACEIDRIGFDCFDPTGEDWSERDEGVLHWEGSSTTDLEKCIPRNLKIECMEEKKFKKVVVWSPKLGCQVVQKSSESKRNACFSATLNCPCIKDRKESGTVCLYTRSWIVPCALYVLQLLICLFTVQ
ncbi:uncharacterized protein LOC119552040 isoform X1 [Drosophila subpulchrella]|uniref:uncharacterized protein LOC119552040 isoform X1 n=1 Tax=Drosophila subpulchrella TaxID=1486046 RepID=UPI0018A18B37|nr:uncharacterized protein LOC119552040 isoform X1 [Drosophila subpulchrella]